MPTYEYRCTDCGHTFDAVQAFTDDALTECPNCGGRLKKLFGNVGIAFKGSGFYRNDSRSGAKSTPSSTSTPPSSSDSSSNGSSTSNGSGGGSSSDSGSGAGSGSTEASTASSSTSKAGSTTSSSPD
jgi:putative FmdB family regulatory protein